MKKIVALLVLWYIDHGHKQELIKLAPNNPLIKTMLQRYENAKAAAIVTLGLTKRTVDKDIPKRPGEPIPTNVYDINPLHLPRDVRNIINKMIKTFMFDSTWDSVHQSSKQPKTKHRKMDNSTGGSKRNTKQLGKKSLGKKSLGKKSLGKNSNKRKKSIRKKSIRKKPM